MVGRHAFVLSGAEVAEADLRLVKLIELAGVRCQLVPADDFFGTTGSDFSKTDCGVAISAALLQKVLVRDASKVRQALTGTKGTLIYAVNPESFSPPTMESFVPGVFSGFAQTSEKTRLRISHEHRDVCGAMSGLTVDQPVTSTPWILLPQPSKSDIKTLIGADEGAALAQVDGTSFRILFWTGTEVLSSSEVINRNLSAAEVSERLLPPLLFARSVFGAACWRAGENLASLIIDDPLLRSRYGFLDLRELLRQTELGQFAANVAFIPWNARRSKKPIIEALKKSERVGLCIHGCDHTRGEFGSDDTAWLDTLAQVALERMIEHQERTGLRHDKIMVFPQGVFSSSAMTVLRDRGFLAAVNTEVVPDHHSANRGSIAAGALLQTAMTNYGGLPLFSRRPCNDPLINYALDLFLGKPCLLVSHHDDFRFGFSPILKRIREISELEPNLEWTTLGRVLERSYAIRQLSADTMQVRLFIDQATVRNSEPGPIRFEFIRTNCGSVETVQINGTNIPFDVNSGVLSFHCVIERGSAAYIKIVNNVLKPATRQSIGLKYRARTAARRYLSEFRDDYVQPLKHAFFSNSKNQN